MSVNAVSLFICSVPQQLLENRIIRRDIEKVLDGLVNIYEGKRIYSDDMPRELKAAIMRKIAIYTALSI